MQIKLISSCHIKLKLNLHVVSNDVTMAFIYTTQEFAFGFTLAVKWFNIEGSFTLSKREDFIKLL